MKRRGDLSLGGTDAIPAASDDLMAMLTGSSDEALVDEGRILILKTSQCQPDPNQPRKTITEAEIADMAQSIEENGQLQAIVVRPPVNGIYPISKGECRWRSCIRLGIDIEAVVKKPKPKADWTDELAEQIVENDQRNDIPPLELAQSLQKLVKAYKEKGKNKQDLASKLGRSPSWLSKRLSILNAAEPVQELASKAGVADVNALNELNQLHKEDPEKALEIAQGAQDGTLESPMRESISDARKKVKEFRQGKSLFDDDQYHQSNDETADTGDDAPPASKRQPFNEDQQELPGVEPGDNRPSVPELVRDLRRRSLAQLKGLETLSHLNLDSVIQAFSTYCEDTRPESFEEAWALFVQHRG